MHSLRGALLLVPVLALALVACSEEKDSQGQDGPEQVVREFHQDLSNGDHDDACDLLTGDYRKRIPEEWIEAPHFLPGGVTVEIVGVGDINTCEDAFRTRGIVVDAIEDSDQTEPVVAVGAVETEIDGDKASVRVAYEENHADGQTFKLVHTQGEWLIEEIVVDNYENPEPAKVG